MAQRQEPTLSLIIPVRNGEADLPHCLEALRRSRKQPDEVIVVDDGSSDRSREIAASYGAAVVALSPARGPAVARNCGAKVARGTILLFLDADVCLHPDAIERILDRFRQDPDLDALIGAYDDQPSAGNFLSQYKNLLHCFVHRTSSPAAKTFWTGIGAIRRDVFWAFGGLDESFERPSVEDIELGLRLARAHRRILLDPLVQGCHRKRYTFASLLKVDILDRGIPWMELILREKRLPNDLNLRWSQRWSILFVWLLVMKLLTMAVGFDVPGVQVGLASLAAANVCAVAALNWPQYCFFFRKRGVGFALRTVPLNFLFHFYNGLSVIAGFWRHFLSTSRSPAAIATPSLPSGANRAGMR